MFKSLKRGEVNEKPNHEQSNLKSVFELSHDANMTILNKTRSFDDDYAKAVGVMQEINSLPCYYAEITSYTPGSGYAVRCIDMRYEEGD